MIKRRIAIMVFAIFAFTACVSEVNEYGLDPFDSNGVISHYFTQNLYSAEVPQNIVFYVESSGSMNGLFRPKLPTDFKYTVSAILLQNDIANHTGGICVFNNNGTEVTTYDIQSYRDKMNDGNLISRQSTIVPNMLKKILGDIDKGICNTAVLISDMKYSPVGISSPEIAMNQYKLDIASLFQGRNDLSISIIGFESNYIGSNGMNICEEFPYYLTIIGKSAEVAWIRNVIIETTENQKCRYQGVLNFNMNYGCPKYTMLPYTCIGMLRNRYEYLDTTCNISTSYASFDSSVIPGEAIVAVNFRHLPTDVLNSLSVSDFSIKSYWNDLKPVLMDIYTTLPPTTEDKALIDYVEPNVFFKIQLNGLSNYNSDMIKITINDESYSNDYEWIEKYYGAFKESELDKTISIDMFIDGLENAYHRNQLQNTPMFLFVTSKNL